MNLKLKVAALASGLAVSFTAMSAQADVLFLVDASQTSRRNSSHA